MDLVIRGVEGMVMPASMRVGSWMWDIAMVLFDWELGI